MIISNTVKKSVFFLILSLFPAIFFLLINYKWDVNIFSTHPKLVYLLLLVTNTAGNPYFIISAIFLFIIISYYSYKKYNLFSRVITLLFIIGCSFIFSFFVKSITKNVVKKPRPYLEWLSNNNKLDIKEFYNNSKEDMQSIIKNIDYKNNNVPSSIINHWSKETSYSFPSAHTLFAVICFFWILLTVKNKFIIGFFICWELMVQISRIILGTHYSIDVICSVFIGWFIALLFYSLSKFFNKRISY